MRKRIMGIAAALLLLGGGWWTWMRWNRFDLASTDLRHTWRPTVLLPWIAYGTDFGGAAAWHVDGAAADPRLDEWFARLAAGGAKAVVWFLFSDGRGSLVFDDAGYVRGLAPGFWNDYHAVLAAAKKRDLKVIWVVTDYELGMPMQRVGGLQMFGHADVFEDPGKRQSFLQNALLPVLRERRGRSQIAGWLAINEPEQILRKGYVDEGAIRSFVVEAAAAIRQNGGLPVGLANSDLRGMLQFADIAQLDFLVFHDYGSRLPPPASYIRSYLADNGNQAASRKPIFIGEFNLNFPPGGDLIRFVAAAKAFGYAGLWPWSLRNRANESATVANDGEPQFGAMEAYMNAMRTEQESTIDIKNDLLPQIDERLGALKAQSTDFPYVVREAATERRWLEWLRRQLTR